jgi:hypothetical protein
MAADSPIHKRRPAEQSFVPMASECREQYESAISLVGAGAAEVVAVGNRSGTVRSAGSRPKVATESEPRRYVLPKNLRDAVKHLSDGELELMYAATLEELKHRGKTPKSVETNLSARPDLTKIQSLTAKLKAADVSLTRGQMNAVRSAFKAGITPSRIAREFRIALADVRQALARDEMNR